MRTHLHPIIKKLIIRLSAFFDDDTVSICLEVSKRTIRRVRALWRQTGAIAPKRVTSGRKRLLDASASAYVEGLVLKRKDLFLDEIQREVHGNLGLDVSATTIWRTLKRQGYSRKKISKEAIERDERKRADYCLTIGSEYKREQLVFLDECSVDKRNCYRQMGWSLRGAAASRKACFVRGKRYSILPALSLNGVLDVAIVLGSFDAVLFKAFIANLLEEMNEFPAPNSVLVMDNVPVHKSPEIRQMVEARGMRLVYLPPYSPDFNPIEEAFSATKAWIQRNDGLMLRALSSRNPEDAIEALTIAVGQAMTPEKAHGWFSDCGYGVPELIYQMDE